jgi:hypothetical protein
MRIRLAAYFSAIAGALFLGRFELHTDDAGVVAFFILALTFLLGYMHPRHCWQWALPVGPAVPLADLLFKGARFDLVLLGGFVVALGLAGSYTGAFLRSLVSSRPSASRMP